MNSFPRGPRPSRPGPIRRSRIVLAVLTLVAAVLGAPADSARASDLGAARLSADLRVTEVMFHAAAGSTNDFLEFHNAGTSTLSLAGAAFTAGIEYTFPAGAALVPGGYLLVVKAPATANFAAFRTVYGLGAAVPIYGPYGGNLSDGGERVTLTSPGGTEVLSFNYGDGWTWPLAADGAGHSLVPRTDVGPDNSRALDFGGNWRASANLGGSPGAADPEPDRTIVLNEIVAHTDYLSEFDSNDWIELHNRGTNAVTLGVGWYLTDDPDNLRRWAIPAGTVIPARGFVAFDEVTGFNHPYGTGFSIAKAGEQILLSRFPAGQPGRVVDAVRFAAQENEWAWARVPDGGDWWDAVIPRTRGTANPAILPRVELAEILFHEGGLPTNQVAAANLEFVEIHNATGRPAELFDTNAVWRVSGGIDFSFPVPVTLATDERIVLVSFDPRTNAAALAGFRATFQVPSAVRIFGPYDGRLDNDTDRVALEHAQAPDQPGDPITWVIVDSVDYFDASPWPTGANGEGRSLNRRTPLRPGSDPSSWFVAAPTPGRAASSPAADTDGDGMPDDWEKQYGFDPANPADATLDADGDGLDNRSEYRAGTDPRDPSSVLRLRAAWSATAGSVDLLFSAVAGHAYRLEEAAAIPGGPWTTVQDIPSAATNRTVTVTVAAPPARVARFHRVVLP